MWTTPIVSNCARDTSLVNVSAMNSSVRLIRACSETPPELIKLSTSPIQSADAVGSSQHGAPGTRDVI